MTSVKLSDVLVLDARTTGRIADRSLSGQVEHWAELGRALERVLRVPDALALKKNVGALTLDECLSIVGTHEGIVQLNKVLDAKSFPHFEPDKRAGYVVRIDADGTRTVGRFIKRQFIAEEANPVVKKSVLRKRRVARENVTVTHA